MIPSEPCGLQPCAQEGVIANNNKKTVRSSCFAVRFFLSCPFGALILFGLLPPAVLAENIDAVFKPLATGGAWVYSIGAEFDEVKDSLVEAIESRGMVISYVSHAETMLARTAESLGGKVVYSDAEVLLFCKANLAHRLVEANPHNLVLCPYAMSVYALHNAPERIYVGIRAPQEKVDEYQAVHEMLVEVIAEALAEQ